MKLKFLHENTLEELRENIENNLESYKSNSNEWIFEFFQNNNPFLEFKKEIPESFKSLVIEAYENCPTEAIFIENGKEKGENIE